MAAEEAGLPDGVVGLDVPEFAQQSAGLRPGVVGGGEVVALGHDQAGPRVDDVAGGHRFVEVAVEVGDVDVLEALGGDPAQQGDVAVRVEGRGCALAVAQAEAVELGGGEVEAVQGEVGGAARALPALDLGDEVPGQGGLAGGGRAGETEDGAGLAPGASQQAEGEGRQAVGAGGVPRAVPGGAVRVHGRTLLSGRARRADPGDRSRGTVLRAAPATRGVRRGRAGPG